ncbi:MAG: hypothetical protein JNM02_03335 [Anaerolineales bacterium]|nr:hypothetical protein [Anaerolineales bacterium]
MDWNMEPLSTKKFLQTFLWTSILLSVMAIVQTVQRVNELEILLWRSKWVFLLGIFALNIAAGFFVLFSPFLERSSRWMDSLGLDPSSVLGKLFGLALVVSGFFLIWAVRLFFFGRFLPQLTPILWVFLWASLLQVFGLKLLSGLKWYPLFAAVILLQGVVYQVYGRVADISDYPFSIGYSEASRHYYASLFYAKSLYGIQTPYPFLHPSRYLLMSLPFLVEELPLWFHRMWQSLLWLVLTFATALLLVARMR